MPTTTSRLLTLLSLLQTRRDWSGPVLADRLGISHRTVRRDVERLRELGYRIGAAKGPEGGYRLEAGSDLPPLLFDDDQAVALAVALHAAAVTGLGIEEAAVRALTTVRQVLPSRLRHRLDAVNFTTLRDRPVDAVAPEVLVALSTAVRAREVVRFDYARADEGSDAARPPLRVEPHGVVTAQGRWYLLGWDLELDDWRIYRADRIGLRTPNGPRFTPRSVPGGSVADFVAARFKGSDSANEWPCVGSVVLHLPAGRVRPFAEGTVEEISPGRCRVEGGSWSWGALAASFGRFECEVEVVGPPELAEAFAVVGERFAAAARSA